MSQQHKIHTRAETDCDKANRGSDGGPKAASGSPSAGMDRMDQTNQLSSGFLRPTRCTLTTARGTYAKTMTMHGSLSNDAATNETRSSSGICKTGTR